ncbi:hypothetical protein QL285_028602 [Trifolium repens]|nr:hypothetical protein QL285_028602 [Trifolium repens]
MSFQLGTMDGTKQGGNTYLDGRSLLFKPSLISDSQTLIASQLKPLIFTPQIFNFSLHTQIPNRYSSHTPQIPNRFQFYNLMVRLMWSVEAD